MFPAWVAGTFALGHWQGDGTGSSQDSNTGTLAKEVGIPGGGLSTVPSAHLLINILFKKNFFKHKKKRKGPNC